MRDIQKHMNVATFTHIFHTDVSDRKHPEHMLLISGQPVDGWERAPCPRLLQEGWWEGTEIGQTEEQDILNMNMRCLVKEIF